MKRAALIILLLTTRVRAEINGAETIEWIVSDSDVVVVARIIDVKTDMVGNHQWSTVTLDVAETMKGQHVPRRFVYIEGDASHLRRNAPLLFGLVQGSRRHGPGTPVPFPEDLLIIRDRHFDLDNKPKVYTCDFAVHREGADILRVARTAASFPKPSRANILIAPPWNSPAHGSLFSGSAVFLVMPADQRWRDRVFESGIYGRGWGAGLGKDLADADNIAFFRQMLTHPLTQFRYPKQWKRSVEDFLVLYYPWRDLAFDVLREWGAEPPPIVIEEPITRYDRVHGIVLALLLAVPLVIAAILYRFTRRARIGYVTWLSLILCVICIGFWITSRHRYSNLVFAVGGHEHELAVSHGHFNWLCVASNPELRGWRVSSRSIEPPARPIHLDSLQNSVIKGFAGIHLVRGQFVAPVLQPLSFPYRLIRLHLAWVLGLLCVMPTVKFLSAVFAIRRRRIRESEGLCVQCGYDLRGSSGVCPECGTEK